MKAYIVTDKARGWVAGRAVSVGETVMLAQDDAAYEVARGLLRPADEPVAPIEAPAPDLTVADPEPLVTRGGDEQRPKPARKKRGA